MRPALMRLLQLAGRSLSRIEPSLSADLLEQAGGLASELLSLLRQRNGFYAFESALRVLPAQSHEGEIGVDLWNDPTSWRVEYGGMADNGLFFAEDVFGGQFAAKSEGVYQFDPETGDQRFIAGDLEGWAREILSDYEVLTGFPTAHEWQRRHGPIPSGKRLVPKVPFVLGGEYRMNNLHLLDAVKGMQLRGGIATQIRDLPDGTPIRLNIVK